MEVEAIETPLNSEIVNEAYEMHVGGMAYASHLLREAWAERHDLSDEESVKMFDELHNKVVMKIMPIVIEECDDAVQQMSLFGALSVDFAVNMIGYKEMLKARWELDEILNGNIGDDVE